MGYAPNMLGNRVLETTHLTAVAGVLPYRVVVLDPSHTQGVGDDQLAPVKLASASNVNDGTETPYGVVVDPAKLKTVVNDAQYTPTSLWDAWTAIAINRQVTVRSIGTVPIVCDITTDTTAITAGCLVMASESNAVVDAAGTTVTMAGTIEKCDLTNNAPSAATRPVGIALHACAPSTDQGRYVLTLLRPWTA